MGEMAESALLLRRWNHSGRGKDLTLLMISYLVWYTRGFFFGGQCTEAHVENLDGTVPLLAALIHVLLFVSSAGMVSSQYHRLCISPSSVHLPIRDTSTGTNLYQTLEQLRDYVS